MKDLVKNSTNFLSKFGKTFFYYNWKKNGKI